MGKFSFHLPHYALHETHRLVNSESKTWDLRHRVSQCAVPLQLEVKGIMVASTCNNGSVTFSHRHTNLNRNTANLIFIIKLTFLLLVSILMCVIAIPTKDSGISVLALLPFHGKHGSFHFMVQVISFVLARRCLRSYKNTPVLG